jgi:hypothetical protein
MKIAIIGGGWLGCHIANKFKDVCSIKLFEKDNIFGGSSFYNQNRLHAGFHYSRNSSTRTLCQNTFKLFRQDYDSIISDINKNYYVVPNHKSLLDFNTFKRIFEYEGIPFNEAKIDVLNDIEGSIIVDEKYIDPNKARQYFEHRLSDIIVKHNVLEEELNTLTKQNDLVINVTNNVVKPIYDHYYELSLTLVYIRDIEKHFGAITMVDGPLFSIYPYGGKNYTVTDVEYTPLYKSDNLQDIYRYKSQLVDKDVTEIKLKMEQKIKHYYTEFNKHFRYKGYYTSIKVKNPSQSADRSPTIVQDKNLISCVTGKIQGIYTLENYIQNEITNR